MIKLKIARIKKGWTQEKLSEESGVNRITISKIESGKQSIEGMQVGILIKLAKALNSTPQELFFSDEE